MAHAPSDHVAFSSRRSHARGVGRLGNGGLRPGQAAPGRRARLRGAVGATLLRRAPGGDLRAHPPDRPALQHADAGGPLRQDGDEAGR